MNKRSLMVMAVALVLSACTVSDAMAQTRYKRVPQGYRAVPQYHIPRYQPVPIRNPWVGPRSFNVSTPGGLNVHVNPFNGRGSLNFRGFRIGF